MAICTVRRDHALLLATLQTGLRLSEAAALGPRDVTFGAGAHVEILGKGRKQRVVPLCKPVANVLRAWLEELDAEPDGFVFSSTRGGRLSPDAVAGLLKKHIDVPRRNCASVAQKQVTFHYLRDTTAMDLLHAGLEQTVIALWMGHDSIETTQFYLVASPAISSLTTSGWPFSTTYMTEKYADTVCS